MFRRLNFLLPNAKLAQKVVNELSRLGVNEKNIHTYTEHNLPTGSLNLATENQANNEAQLIEDIFWKGNLTLFFVFLTICIIALSTQQYFLSLMSLGVMILSFAVGNFFVKHIPHTHLGEFKHAVNHNELLMMVDVPDENVGFIENTIHRHHPAAIEGGSSWTLKGIDI
ncbi:MAG: hypothetical protein DIZ80_07020 [endosymbiont of Galathealinum brachiosum]|uniref:Uncharacterized protein n=1 Tax=endosymbiont of Galathealinum brachiosum TaxID=2200906 RepID=A0A370DH63_9GAMM|nr:MAG: hypothetical protein DIZ80_07020 [endosymbiont of Galathealinum brachiosum]